ncbi:MAG: hypothetical protein ACRDOA_05605 [Streptosporangiaceae bacterium]
MIRRGFWLVAGAVTGIYGYRRVSAVGRRLSASLNPAAPAALTQSTQSTQSAQSARSAQSTRSTRSAQRAQLARQGRRTALRAARETYRFTRDVREGMDLYMARHSDAAGSTLSTDQSTTHEPKDGH